MEVLSQQDQGTLWAIFMVISVVSFIVFPCMIGYWIYNLNYDYHEHKKTNKEPWKKSYFLEWFPKHPIISVVILTTLSWFIFNFLIGLLFSFGGFICKCWGLNNNVDFGQYISITIIFVVAPVIIIGFIIWAVYCYIWNRKFEKDNKWNSN